MGLLDKLREYKEQRDKKEYQRNQERLVKLETKERYAKKKVEVQQKKDRIRELERKTSVTGRLSEKIKGIKAKEKLTQKETATQLKRTKKNKRRKTTKKTSPTPQQDLGFAGLFPQDNSGELFGDNSQDVLSLYTRREKKKKGSDFVI